MRDNPEFSVSTFEYKGLNLAELAISRGYFELAEFFVSRGAQLYQADINRAICTNEEGNLISENDENEKAIESELSYENEKKSIIDIDSLEEVEECLERFHWLDIPQEEISLWTNDEGSIKLEVSLPSKEIFCQCPHNTVYSRLLTRIFVELFNTFVLSEPIVNSSDKQFSTLISPKRLYRILKYLNEEIGVSENYKCYLFPAGTYSSYEVYQVFPNSDYYDKFFDLYD